MKNTWKSFVPGGALLILLSVVAYLPALSGKFVWDDDSWTTRISGLLSNLAGLRLMWTQASALQQYYPLTGTTFWMDYHFWGYWTVPYHVENLLLHIVAVLLFWGLLRRLQVPGAWLGGAIFALHPVMVESVAWITERKNVLSLVLYLGALMAYGSFTRFWRDENNTTAGVDSPLPRRWNAYALAFVLLLAALLAKTTAFSLPAVILLICWWKRGRIRWRADTLPTLPFFGVAIGFCLVTAWLEKNHVGAKGADWAISLPERCLIAGRALWFYAGHLLWPANLCFVYPRWQLDSASLWQWLYPIGAVGALFTLWLGRGRIGRGPAAAAFFFAGTLFPVLGFLNAYFMRYSFVCDHWVYLSSLGLIALAAALVTRVAGYFRIQILFYGIVTVVLLTLGMLTWRQCGIYADPETLWRDTLARNPEAWLAHNNLGNMLGKQGRFREGIEHYNEAVRIHPDSSEVQNDFALALVEQGDVDEAIKHYEHALRLDPDYSAAHHNLGLALALQGKFEEAIAQWKEALRLNPNDPNVHYNWGVALKQMGRNNDAIEQYEQALRIKPDYADVRDNLGNALLAAGRISEAIKLYSETVKIQPDSVRARINLALVLEQQGRIDEAIKQYEQALRLNPKYPDLSEKLSQVRRDAASSQPKEQQ